MIPPATPAGLSIVRISLSAAHSDDDLSLIIASLAEQAERLDSARSRLRALSGAAAQPSSTSLIFAERRAAILR